MTDITTIRHLEVQIEKLNSFFEKAGLKTRFHLDKDLTGWKLVNQNYHEFTRKRNTKTELWDKLDAINEVLLYFIEKRDN